MCAQLEFTFRVVLKKGRGFTEIQQGLGHSDVMMVYIQDV